MPQVIAGPIALAAFNIGAPLWVANAIVGVGIGGTILYTGGAIALSVGASYAAGQLFAPKGAKPSDGQIEFTQAIPDRFFYYGRNKSSGPVSFFERAPGSNERELFRHILIEAREIDGFEEHWLDDIEVEIDVGGLVLEQFGELVHLFPHLGPDAQTVDTTTLDRFPTEWSSGHRLRGIAYVVAVYNQGANPDDYQFVYANGIPKYETVKRSARVYDPTKDTTNGGSGSHRMDNPSTWEWTDEQRLCSLDWLTYPEGYGRQIGFDRIDWATWIPQILMGRELVPLKNGGTEKRYRLATRVGLDEPKKDVLARLRQAGDQRLFMTRDGKIGSRGGVWAAPTISFDADDIAASSVIEAEMSSGVPGIGLCNEFQLKCMLPTHGYSEVDLEPWSNVDDLLYQAGDVRRQALDLTQVPSHAQAQRLAKIYMKRENPHWLGTIKTNFAGFHALGEAAVNFAFDQSQPTAAPYWIDGEIRIMADGVELPLRSADPDAYEWDAASEETDPPDVPPEINYAGV